MEQLVEQLYQPTCHVGRLMLLHNNNYYWYNNVGDVDRYVQLCGIVWRSLHNAVGSMTWLQLCQANYLCWEMTLGNPFNEYIAT